MALPPLPPSNTDRLFYDYTTGRKAHTFIVRVGVDSTLGTADLNATNFVGSLQGILPDAWAITGVRYAAAGSDVTLPFVGSLLTGFTGGGGPLQALENEPQQINWVGRGSATGRKVRVGLYGIKQVPVGQYRITVEGTLGPLNDALQAIRTASNSFVTIGGDEALWKGYVNLNFNSYWETEARP